MTALAVPAAAGVLMLLLAAWLMRVAADNRAARAFSAVLAVRALALASLSAAPMVASVDAIRLTVTAYAALDLAALIAATYFATVYPHRRGWLSRGAKGPLVFVAATGLLVAPLLLSPDLARPYSELGGSGLESLANWIFGARQGPYGSSQTLFDLGTAVLAFVFYREYVRAPRGRRRGTLLLVSLGFFAPAACSCLMAAAVIQLRGVLDRPADPSFFNFLEMGLFAAWFFMLSGMSVFLVAKALRSGEAELRRHAALFALVLVVSGLLGTSVALLPTALASLHAIFVMVGGWSALGAVLVTYGVLRHRLFDIDLTLKLTLERGTVAAVFVATYFLVSEVSAQLFADFSGSPYLGIGAAALLLLALQPLQKMVESVVSDAMPNTKPLDELGVDEAVAFYRENLELMWMDGHLSSKDRLVLGKLRERLGLTPDRAEQVELDVLQARIS